MQVITLESMSVPIGARVRIEPRGKDGENKAFTGTIVTENKRHFTVRGDKYSQSFLKVDLVISEISLMPVRFARREDDVVYLMPRTREEAKETGKQKGTAVGSLA